jgi:hypothetical protein
LFQCCGIGIGTAKKVERTSYYFALGVSTEAAKGVIDVKDRAALAVLGMRLEDHDGIMGVYHRGFQQAVPLRVSR